VNRFREMRRTTIGDVARQAGVGKVTVSYVLNGRARERRISQATTERILRAAKDLNYTPNAVGQMLAQRKTNSIAVVLQGARYFASTSSFIPEVLRGVCDEGVEQGVDIMLHTRLANSVEEDANHLASGRVDGALILRDAGDPLVRELKLRQLPIVSFFSRPDVGGVPYVDLDNFTGGRLAAQHLLGLGHRRLGVIAGSPNSVDATDRVLGFCTTAAAANATVESRTMYSPLDHPDEFCDLMSLPSRPTALFVWSDDVAFHCMSLASAMGISVPRDLSIVGFDSTPACLRVSPHLTSVRQPISTMARAATKLLTDVMRGEAPDMQQIIYPPLLDVRASTAPLSYSSTQR
jgi:LacI family transcriptional regulator